MLGTIRVPNLPPFSDVAGACAAHRQPPSSSGALCADRTGCINSGLSHSVGEPFLPQETLTPGCWYE